MRLLRGESKEVISREIGVEIYRLEEWQQKALKGIDASLIKRRTDPQQVELLPMRCGVRMALVY